MKLSILFTINAVVATLFGLAFLIIPAPALAQYGLTADSVTAVMSRFFASALLGYGILAWYARNAEDSPARQAIVIAYFVSNVIGFVVALQTQFTTEVNQLGWLTVVIYLFFAVGYGYFQFAKPKEV